MKISQATVLIFSLMSVDYSVAFVANSFNPICPAPIATAGRNMGRFQPLQMVAARPDSGEFSFTMPFVETFQKHQEDMERSQARKRRRMFQLEKEVRASTQAKLDLGRVREAFMAEEAQFETHTESEGTVESTDQQVSTSTPATATTSAVSTIPTQFSIALASGSALGLLSFALIKIPLLSFLIFGLTSYVAIRDPIRDEELFEGDISGPITRVVGRVALDSIENAIPKIRAITRAVIATGDFDVLRGSNSKLEQENKEIKLWMERRKAIDAQAKYYAITDLKDIARENELKVSGTKAELMMRLIEKGCLRDNQEQYYKLEQLKKIARKDKIKVSGTKSVLMKRLLDAGSLKILV